MTQHRRPTMEKRAIGKTTVALSALFVLAALLAAPSLFADYTYSVTVDTSGLLGTSADLAFDLINGGSASNTLTISDFSTDGTLGGISPTGEVSGTLPGIVTLMDSPSSFFNEYLTGITLGTTFSFEFDATENGPGPSGVPDAFSMFLLDPSTGLPLSTTSDPTGADSLLTINIDGSPLDVYSNTVTAALVTPPVPTPETNTLLLLGTGVGGVLLLVWTGKTALNGT